MSTRSLNWVKFGALMALAFVLGLFFAGLLDFPRAGMAQQEARANHAPIIKVDAPHIPAARPLVELSDAYAAVAEAVRPSVVYIESERPMSGEISSGLPPGFEQIIPRQQQRRGRAPAEAPVEHSSGSGFIVSSDGYILTNNHVIEGSSRVTVGLLDGRRYTARIIGRDKNTDIGVLKIDATGLTPAALGESAKSRVGEWVLAIGNPLGSQLTFSVTQGIISAKGRGRLDRTDTNTVAIMDFIQTDAAINRGNSGGPLVNVRGEVIGINAAIASETGFYAGYAFAVPIDLARKVMEQIIAYGHVERAGLGIRVGNASAEDAQYLGLDSISGVIVGSFGDNSPAERAGIQRGDVITAINGQPIAYTAQLQQMVGFMRPGEVVKVEVARKGGKKDFNVRLMNIGLPAVEENADSVVKNAPASTSKNRLGITVEPVTAAMITQLALPSSTRGVLVKSIPHNSPLDGTVCPVDDGRCAPEIITSVEGKAIHNEAELQTALGSAVHGVVTLELLSTDGKGQTATRLQRVKVGEK